MFAIDRLVELVSAALKLSSMTVCRPGVVQNRCSSVCLTFDKQVLFLHVNSLSVLHCMANCCLNEEKCVVQFTSLLEFVTFSVTVSVASE